MADRKFTDLELERSLADDLHPARAAALATDATDADRARLGELRAEHEAFLRETDVEAEVAAIHRRAARLAPVPKPRFQWMRWLVPAGALAAAAAVMLMVTRRTPVAPDDPDLQTKGDGITLVIHMRTGAESKRLASQDTIPTGARIRFQITAGKRGYLAVIGVDAKSASLYFPQAVTSPAVYEPTNAGLLPGAIDLDDTPGDERFYAVYAAEPFSLDAAMAALRDHTPMPSGVTHSNEVLLHKTSR
jgi:hypothetical protein